MTEEAGTAGNRSKYGWGTGVPHPIDVHVGKRIRIGRLLRDMSLTTFGKALGVTFQQIEKYENATNRTSAARLSAMAEILGVPISFFFDGLAPGTPEETELSAHLEQRETIELVRLYYAIADARVRQQVLEMVKAVAERTSLPEASRAAAKARKALG
jgi:transcriptional regulator with XRE-family HTH domain